MILGDPDENGVALNSNDGHCDVHDVADRRILSDDFDGSDDLDLTAILFKHFSFTISINKNSKLIIVIMENLKFGN